MVSEFVARVIALNSEFETLDTKINCEHDNVGDIIEQMEFIKHLAASEEIFDNLDRQFLELISQKDFLDELMIKVPSDHFMTFLGMYPYSTKIRSDTTHKIQHMAE
jgi:hypothetical protein